MQSPVFGQVSLLTLAAEPCRSVPILDVSRQEPEHEYNR
jgi:hypothetical protein